MSHSCQIGGDDRATRRYTGRQRSTRSNYSPRMAELLSRTRQAPVPDRPLDQTGGVQLVSAAALRPFGVPIAEDHVEPTLMVLLIQVRVGLATDHEHHYVR